MLRMECECERWRDGATWCHVHGVQKPEPQSELEMFTTEWRTERVRRGDAFLQDALDPNISSELRIAFIAIAQAHYQAANIRSRPGESWLASKEQPTSRTLQAIQRRQQQFDPDADGDQHP